MEIHHQIFKNKNLIPLVYKWGRTTINIYGMHTLPSQTLCSKYIYFFKAIIIIFKIGPWIQKYQTLL